MGIFQYCLYYIFYFLIYGISLLPLRALYLFSDGLFLIIFFIFPYRKKVVIDNLSNSFPEKSSQEIYQIAKEYYSHFCDLIVEVIKAFSMSENSWEKRVIFLSPDVPDHLKELGRGALLIGTHYGNFEWMVQTMARQLSKHNMPSYGIYAPFSSIVFERILMQMREKHGARFFPMRKAMYEALKHLSEVGMFGFIADQSPGRLPILYYGSLLNRPTAFHTSVAKVAIRADCPVYFADMRKVGRGKYTLKLRKLEVSTCTQQTDRDPAECLTDIHIALLEKAIIDKPAFWLWSHRRWKHQPRDGDSFAPQVAGNLSQPG